MVLELPEKVRELLKKESEKRGLEESEIVLEALSSFLCLNPQQKAKVHISLSEKYLSEAEEFLNKKDYVQASKKGWGAASQILKAIALKRGKELRSHSELHRFALFLREEIGDAEIRRLWQVATSLHQNFYENWLPEEVVKESGDDVKKFIERLKNLI